MNTDNKLNFINERPLRNSYCIMTTIHMLNVCMERYKKALKGAQDHTKALESKYYTSSGDEIPPDVREDISETNKQITEYDQIIRDIECAIEVIDVTCKDVKGT